MPYLDLDEENEIEEQAIIETENGGIKKLVIELQLKDNADKADKTYLNNSIPTSTEMRVFDRSQSLASTLFNTVKICIFIIFLISMFFILIKISVQEGTVILPFEVSENDNLSGIAIADQLTAELIQIQKIHNVKYEDITLRTNSSYFAPRFATEQALGNSEMVVPKAGTIEFGMGDIGNIDTGAGSLSMGTLIIAFKNIIPSAKSIDTIRGSLQRDGSTIVLVALLEGNRVQSWMIKRPSNNERDQIPEMIKDLAFMIAFDQQQSDVSAKTWEGLKYYTEALDAYHQYQLSGYPSFLDLAWNNSLRAIKSEKGYKNTYDLMLSILFSYIMIGKENNAIDYSNKIIEVNPATPYGWTNKGSVLHYQGKYEGAIGAYEEAIRLDPGYALAWNGKGTALDNQGKYEEAIEAYEEAIRLDPDFARVWNNKGNALDNQGKYEEAIKSYERAIHLNPDYALAWNGKGTALYNQSKYEEAIDAYEEAIRLDPDYALAWNNKVHALLKQGKYGEAEEAYEEAIRLDPNFAIQAVGSELQSTSEVSDEIQALIV
jgi:tetratricopeptide (TPR) repeat protein